MIDVRPPHKLALEPLVRRALEEDLGNAGDITSELVVPAERRAKALVVAREPGTIAGLIAAEAAFRLVDPLTDFHFEIQDAAAVNAGARLATVEGSARSLLAAERVALNFVGRLSGIAQPTYVLDIPGGHGKVPVGPVYLDGEEVTDPDGQPHAYPAK